MTLYKRGSLWWYTFTFKGRRHQASTHQADRDDAALVEEAAKTRVRREHHGLIAAHPEESPTIQEFANVFYLEQAKRLTRPDILDRTLRVVLGFWGKRPGRHQIAGGPYHDLRLSAPLLDPRWLDAFEQWMTARGLSGSTKNGYLSAMNGIYKLAMKPRYRARTGVDRNPFQDIGRYQTHTRRVTATPEDLVKWMDHAAPHFRLALVIGALAWKLRKRQVLQLRFDQHLDPALTKITFDSHKTIRHTGKPQVTPVSNELRAVLQAVKAARPHATYVVTWRNKPIADLKTAAKQAAARAGLPYGLKAGGVTFHALRHVSATELARMGISAALAGKASGHLDERTTARIYTHLIESDEQRIVDQLGARLNLSDGTVRAVVASVASKDGDYRHIRGAKKGGRKRQTTAKEDVTH